MYSAATARALATIQWFSQPPEKRENFKLASFFKAIPIFISSFLRRIFPKPAGELVDLPKDQPSAFTDSEKLEFREAAIRKYPSSELEKATLAEKIFIKPNGKKRGALVLSSRLGAMRGGCNKLQPLITVKDEKGKRVKKDWLYRTPRDEDEIVEHSLIDKHQSQKSKSKRFAIKTYLLPGGQTLIREAEQKDVEEYAKTEECKSNKRRTAFNFLNGECRLWKAGFTHGDMIDMIPKKLTT